jgi:hypothetical protein
MQEKELVEMVWGLASSKQPFLWVLRTDFPDGIRRKKKKTLYGIEIAM